VESRRVTPPKGGGLQLVESAGVRVFKNIRVNRNGWVQATSKAGTVSVEILRLICTLSWVGNQNHGLPERKKFPAETAHD
jgi:hypothetical protein